MSDRYFLIYPHQLFSQIFELPTSIHLVMVEDPLFFTQYAFHKHKLILHRASMKYMEAECQRRGFNVTYIEYHQLEKSIDIFTLLPKNIEIQAYDPVDDWLEQALHHGQVEIIESPGFYLSRSDIRELFPRKNKTYAMSRFYTAMRRTHNILMEDEAPKGGKWSLDTENRKKLPKDIDIPRLPDIQDWDHLDSAKAYVENHFTNNPGNSIHFFLPTNHTDSTSWFISFLHTRFAQFGPYEDAIDEDEPFLFHSVISPLLNIGLLSPFEIIRDILSYGETHDIPLQSIEGFIRQFIGWREYIRAMYVQKGRYMRTQNFLDAHHDIPQGMYDGTTGLKPLDTVITRLLTYAYTHHIERLMIAGNFFLINHVHPDKVYQWFMELYVDSYDWVMVPNVYGMSQYAAGNLMTTKPYSSGSAYIRRMSNFEKGEWCDVWDGLFWQFIEKHKAYYSKNPRIKMMPKVLRRLSKERKNILWKAVSEWKEAQSS